MAEGLEIYGPDGQVWLSTNQKTTRVLGALTYTNVFSQVAVSIPLTGSARAWAFSYGANRAVIYWTLSEPSGGSQTLTYATSETWPSGGVAHIFYGVT